MKFKFITLLGHFCQLRVHKHKFLILSCQKEINRCSWKTPPHLFPNSLPLCFSDVNSWIISWELKTHRPPHYLFTWLPPLNLLRLISPSPLHKKKVKSWNFPRIVKRKLDKARLGPNNNYFLLSFCHCTCGMIVILAQIKRWWVTIPLLTHTVNHGNNTPRPHPLKLQVRHTTEWKRNLPPKICRLGYWLF